ncbi:uncharacterized protein LOC113510590 [Galleria mellonella]|uniref:Uncharacterized protein LOC113510590 n=1 Tax=Galleria mellonella TaxID=7137 RepID=A0A6J1W9L7_GALME|nr:uncharacterized protein LOC113510590 [Galleria mellonella]
MYDRNIFVFGSKTCTNVAQETLSSLPLELLWKIFSYLDNTSLRNATKAYMKWHRIIASNKKLRNRLNFFELVIKVGSESMAQFYKRNKRMLKRKKLRNYLPTGECTVGVIRSTTFKKRSGDDLVIHTKRFKLF